MAEVHVRDGAPGSRIGGTGGVGRVLADANGLVIDQRVGSLVIGPGVEFVVVGGQTVTDSFDSPVPVAVDDHYTMAENSLAYLDVLYNDLVRAGDWLVIQSFTEGARGRVSLSGSFLRYTPAPGWFGTDVFQYTVVDTAGRTDSATVFVRVCEVADAPQPGDDSATVDEDSTVVVDVLANDLLGSGSDLSILSFTQGAHGTVSTEGDSLRYTPAADYDGSDSFTYEVGDGSATTATAVVRLTVTPVNDLPAAGDDSGTLNEDGTVLIDVLANDSDVDGDTLAVTTFTQGAHGMVAAEGDSLRYTPAADYNGSDSFTYTVSDGNGGTDTAMVSLTVTAVNDAPAAGEDSGTLNEDGTVLIDVLANDSDVDGDTLGVTTFTQGAHGTVAAEGGSLRYTPAADHNGSDSFTYTVSDANGGTDTAMVSLTVTAVNDSPVAGDDTAEVDQDSTTLIDVLVNDSDAEGDLLSIASVTQGTHGAVSVEATTIRYTPDTGYTGADSFTYTISDGNGGFATATVNVAVNAVGPLLSVDISEADGVSDYLPVVISTVGMYQFASSFYLNDCDTVIYVFDSAMTVLAANDDYIDSYGVVILDLDPGTYYVKVENFNLGQPLHCHLEVNQI